MNTASRTLDRSVDVVRPSVASSGGLTLQRKCACGTHTAGGECAECSKKKLGLQRKLTIGATDDPLEREADRIADQVMAMPAHAISANTPPRIQRVSASPVGCAGSAPSSVDQVLSSRGEPLEPALRQDMEGRFGYDFSGVRVHTDSAAAQSARDIDAQAFTAGHHIVFGRDRYAPAAFDSRHRLAHELVHVLQQVRASDLSGAVLGPVNANGIQRQRETAGLPRNPENFATYEDWLESFPRLPDFPSSDVPAGIPLGQHNVLGDQAALNRGTPVDESSHRHALPPPPPPMRHPQEGEEFIDHPTDDWVTHNLDPELRRIAYLLPADCADIAVVLRHVWLFAHGRGENYRGWRIGTLAGRTEAARMREMKDLLRQRVGSGSVARIVDAYRDSNGRPIRSFDGLEPLLHEGDILVWDHRESGGHGGHTSTIESIERDPSTGRITGMSSLQGNQPLGPAEALAIMHQAPGRESLTTDRMSIAQRTEWLRLRNLPGRRIERANVLISFGTGHVDLPIRAGRRRQTERVWQWSDGHTVLVVAGPPHAARRPTGRVRRRGHLPVSPWTLWARELRAASNLQQLQAEFEGALLDLRSTMEGGRSVRTEDADAIGSAVGERLWNLATSSARRRGSTDFGVETHFDPLHRLIAVVRSMSDDANPPHRHDVESVFLHVETALGFAARGAAGIHFPARRRELRGRTQRTVGVLVSGFDPFGKMRPPTAPSAGEWNPSGAAALALDGWSAPVLNGVRVNVETVIFPVSFQQFGRGLVEHVVREHIGDLDAVITVSMNSKIGLAEPVTIERYAAGTHRLLPIQTHRLLAPEDSPDRYEAIPTNTGGPAESPLMETIDSETFDRIANAARSSTGIPNHGIQITLRFRERTLAVEARRVLGGTVSQDGDLIVQDANRILQSRLRWVGRTSATVAFDSGSRTFTAVLVRGPGGSFLWLF